LKSPGFTQYARPAARRSRIAAGIVGVTVVLVGCSGGAAKTSSASAPPASQAGSVASPVTATSAPPVTGTNAPLVATGTGACRYVTTAQAAALAASPVKAGVARSLASGPVPFEYCDYIFDPGNAPGVTVAVASLGGNGASLFAQFRAAKQQSGSDYEVVSGTGDEAFYASGNLNVRKGDTGLILFVGRSASYPRGAKGLPDEKALAALVLGQL
jgi:hypothetical protein